VLALADCRGKAGHQSHGGPVVELLAPRQRLPGSEVDGEAQNGAQQRPPDLRSGPVRQEDVARLAQVGEAPPLDDLLDDGVDLGVAEQVRPARLAAPEVVV
jgi:hypothetical protein